MILDISTGEPKLLLARIDSRSERVSNLSKQQSILFDSRLSIMSSPNLELQQMLRSQSLENER
jgi:hypothetical protein